MRDIGYYFPNSEKKWKNAKSSIFVEFCAIYIFKQLAKSIRFWWGFSTKFRALHRKPVFPGKECQDSTRPRHFDTNGVDFYIEFLSILQHFLRGFSGNHGVLVILEPFRSPFRGISNDF